MLLNKKADTTLLHTPPRYVLKSLIFHTQKRF